MLDIFTSVFDLTLLYVVGIAFLAGVMFGYTGWGAGLVAMPLLTLLFGPVEALAIFIIGALLVIVHIAPDAARKAEWRAISLLLVGQAVFIPLGSIVLFYIDPELLRRAIGVVIIAAALVILRGWRFPERPGIWVGALTGTVSGFLNGSVGLGGPALVIYMLSTAASAIQQRANLVIINTWVSVLVLSSLFIGGGLSLETVFRGLASAPAQWLGAMLGVWMFSVLRDEMFRNISLIALVILGLSVTIF